LVKVSKGGNPHQNSSAQNSKTRRTAIADYHSSLLGSNCIRKQQISSFGGSAK